MEGDPIMSVRFFLFLVVATVQLVATQAWAQPKQLKGSQFVTAMKSDTLTWVGDINLTARFVIQLLLLKRLHLGFGEG